jgi:hypothetical protein
LHFSANSAAVRRENQDQAIPPVLFSVLCGKKMDYEFSTAMEFAATARDSARRWLMTPTESIPVL